MTLEPMTVTLTDLAVLPMKSLTLIAESTSSDSDSNQSLASRLATRRANFASHANFATRPNFATLPSFASLAKHHRVVALTLTLKVQVVTLSVQAVAL